MRPTPANSLEKNITLEAGAGPQRIRTATAADSALSNLNPGALEAAGLVGKVWHIPKGYANGKIRIFAGGSGTGAKTKTCGITLIGQPRDSSDLKPGATDKATPAKGKCRTILKGVATFNGSLTEDIDPSCDEATAGVHWYELSSIDFSSGFRSGRVVLDPEPTDQAAADYELTIKFDIDGDQDICLLFDNVDAAITKLSASGELMS